MTIRMPGLRDFCLALAPHRHRGRRCGVRPAGAAPGRPRAWTASPRSSGPAVRRGRSADRRLPPLAPREPPGQHADGAGGPRSRRPEAATGPRPPRADQDRATAAPGRSVLLNEGKAYSALGRNDRAEAAWKEALRLEPRVPEAGWDLLGLYYVQGRRAEAHRLGHGAPRRRARPARSRATAPGAGPPGCPADRPRFAHQDRSNRWCRAASGGFPHGDRPGPGLDPQQPRSTRDCRSCAAWSSATPAIRTPGTPAARPGRGPTVRRAGRGPGAVSRRHRGRPAVRAISRPRSPRSGGTGRRPRTPISAPGGPTPPTSRSSTGSAGCSRPPGGRSRPRRSTSRSGPRRRHAIRVLPLYEEANAVKTLGVAPHPDLYHRLADLRERMGRADEALAWHRLVLRDQPDDPTSRAAVAQAPGDHRRRAGVPPMIGAGLRIGSIGQASTTSGSGRHASSSSS